MTPDTALGISVELKFFLKGAWTINEEKDRFRLRLNDSSLTGAALRARVKDTAWEMARTLGYRNFVSVSEAPDGKISVVSRMEDGDGFDLVFEV